MTFRTYEISPRNGRASFYGKCIVKDDGITATLQSYQTDVAVYNYGTGEMTVNGHRSATTSSHVNAFLYSFGFSKMTAQEMREAPTLKR